MYRVVFVEDGSYYLSMVRHETVQDAINYAMTKDYPAMQFHVI